MHIAILHQSVPPDASADERDVLVQVDAISQALNALGHSFSVLPCSLNLADMADRLTSRRPDVVFNLVESLGGTDSLQALAPLVIESLGLPLTGSSGAAILNSGRKGFAKSLLRAAALPTPGWFDAELLAAGGAGFEPGRYILKPVLEHASLGMSDADVIDAPTVAELAESLRMKTTSFGRPCFAEAFIDGREFNLSLLQSAQGVEVLPAAEIRFVDFPPDKPRIVGSAAKWDESSFEYAATVRSLTLPPADAALVEQLSALARRCWQVLDLQGYARVDFRVDEAGRAWILEANANPCLSPDAGFAAAAAHAGLSYSEVVRRILEAAQPRPVK